MPPRSDVPVGDRPGHPVAAVRLGVALTILLVLVASACAADHTLDGSLLEADIADQLLPDYPGVIRSVACPDPPDPAPGLEVLCVATLGADVIDVNVVLGGTEDALTATASVDARFVAVNEVAALLAATFSDEVGLATRVDCGQPVMVLEPDDPVICTATDPSGVGRDFEVRIDDDGVLRLQLR